MGQLERYGLYVLCLVIFLILGVAIWGGDVEPVTKAHRAALRNGSGGQVEVADNNEKKLPSDGERVDDIENYLKERDEEAARNHEIAANIFRNANTPDVEDLNGKDSSESIAPLPAKPAPKVIRTHVVGAGETLGSIARRYLGKSSAWRMILDRNPGVDEFKLKLGTVLKIPERPTISSTKSPNKAAVVRMYKVRKNDSPWSIACKHYGLKNAKRYTDAIMKLNNIADARDLKPGTILKLPPR